MGEQRVDQLQLPGGARLGLEHQAHRSVLARFVAHGIEHGEHGLLQLHLLLRQCLLAGLDLGVGQLLDLFEHLLAADTRRQLGNHQVPLTTRQVLDLPACTHLERTAASGVGIADLGVAADDLAAAGVIGAGDQGVKRVVGQCRVVGLALDQRNRRGRDLAQVVTGDLGGQAHRNARGAVEQRKRQPRRQLPRLFGTAVVVGDEVDRAFVDLVHQQPGNRRQACLGVAHRRGAVTVAAAEVALTVDQRVAQRKVLRHAHQRVVGRLVAVRMEAAQHVADHPGALDRLGRTRSARPAVAQAHALHRIKDAPLHGFGAVADIGQRPALDHAECVLQVGALGVVRQRDGVGVLGRWRWRRWIRQEGQLVGHGVLVLARRPTGCSGGGRRQRRVRPGSRDQSKGNAEQVLANVGALVWAGLQGANHSHSPAMARICNAADRPKQG